MLQCWRNFSYQGFELPPEHIPSTCAILLRQPLLHFESDRPRYRQLIAIIALRDTPALPACLQDGRHFMQRVIPGKVKNAKTKARIYNLHRVDLETCLKNTISIAVYVSVALNQ